MIYHVGYNEPGGYSPPPPTRADTNSLTQNFQKHFQKAISKVKSDLDGERKRSFWIRFERFGFLSFQPKLEKSETIVKLEIRNSGIVECQKPISTKWSPK